jgi:hypothetical protein
VGLEHLTDFRAALFELLFCFQIVRPGWKISLQPDKGSFGCDIIVAFESTPVAAIEAYAPQKGITDWVESEIARPWRILIGEDRDAPANADSSVPQITDLFMDAQVIPSALSNILTDSNFARQKARQLAAGDLPTILAIRAYSLTPTIGNLLTIRSGTDLAASITQDAWAKLPTQCVGLMLCFTSDVLVSGGPLIFIAAPGRTLDPTLREFLLTIGAIT